MNVHGRRGRTSLDDLQPPGKSGRRVRFYFPSDKEIPQPTSNKRAFFGSNGVPQQVPPPPPPPPTPVRVKIDLERMIEDTIGDPDAFTALRLTFGMKPEFGPTLAKVFGKRKRKRMATVQEAVKVSSSSSSSSEGDSPLAKRHRKGEGDNQANGAAEDG